MDFESKEISATDLEKEQATQIKSFCTFRHEEETWRLKSRSLWLKAGDRNTSFFHRKYRAWLSRNHISKITCSDGTVLKGEEQQKKAPEDHSQNLYKEDGNGSEEVISEFLSHIPSLVSKEDNASLTKPFSKEEIYKVIWSMEPDKALGPDDFSIHFYRICWEIIITDLLRMIKYFHQKAKVGGNTNFTFLALIPKEVNSGTYDKFRPISLYNASYKILTKLLANRIKPLLWKLGENQQPGRNPWAAKILPNST